MPSRIRCRWHIVVTATDLDGDPYTALGAGMAHMPEGADVVLQVVGPVGCVNGAAVAHVLADAYPRTIEIWAHGHGVRSLMDALRAVEPELVQ